jgi:hypothetical protein
MALSIIRKSGPMYEDSGVIHLNKGGRLEARRTIINKFVVGRF